MKFSDEPAKSSPLLEIHAMYPGTSGPRFGWHRSTKGNQGNCAQVVMEPYHPEAVPEVKQIHAMYPGTSGRGSVGNGAMPPGGRPRGEANKEIGIERMDQRVNQRFCERLDRGHLCRAFPVSNGTISCANVGAEAARPCSMLSPRLDDVAGGSGHQRVWS